MTTVAFVDESTAGDRREAWHLEVPEERLALRELIRRRVFREVAEHNAKGSPVFNGLVQPGDTETRLNGYRARPTRLPDPEQQFIAALGAFSRNGFVVFVDDRQIEELDAPVTIRPGTTVTFFKLMPLVGG